MPPIPPMLYGTAWKEDATETLTTQAIQCGFRGIDTANQLKHYQESGVGAALRTAATADGISRHDLFVQTKFTFLAGQDHRLPYDPDAPVPVQVAQSMASSLEHLGLDYVDAYVLHGPSRRRGLGSADRAAWRAMESALREGRTHRLGISNVSLEQLEELCEIATIPPVIVQNRCFAHTGWDREVRHFCRSHGIAYQGFSLLTANPQVWRHPRIATLSARYDATPAQLLLRFAIDLGMIPLTGTRDPIHMSQDLAIVDWSLDPDEVREIEELEA